jgi:hypothetical protein
MATSNIGFQSFYQSQLTSAISNTDLTIPLDVLPTPNEGYLVIESTVSAAREIIYYTSKTGTAVVVPSGAGNGRGFDGTTAVSHTQSATVIMAPIGAMFGNQAIKDMLGVTTDVTGGWDLLASGTPSTITALGNRSYTVLVPSADTTSATSVGMRLKLPRTVTAPTQCTDLESGSSQYYSKTSPTGLSFTTTFTCSAWIKLESYAAGGIIARRNADTEGFSFSVNVNGQLELTALRIASNNKYGTSYQSIPLNKWVHVAASMDVTVAGDASTLMYIDGVLVPSTVVTTGTCTALVQGTTALTVGAQKSAGSVFFDGKIAQAAVYSAVLSAATIKAAMNQTLTGSETSLVSAYTFNNSLNDLAATANNLTAQGGALATNADTPFTNPVTGTSVTAGTTNFGIIMAQTFSTNTTYTVQIPEGETLPTTGGIGTVSYSTQDVPYGFPKDEGKWELECAIIAFQTVSFTGTNIWDASSFKLNVPIGAWEVGYKTNIQLHSTASGARNGFMGLGGATSNPLVNAAYNAKLITQPPYHPASSDTIGTVEDFDNFTLSAAEDFTLKAAITASSGTETYVTNYNSARGYIKARNAYL